MAALGGTVTRRSAADVYDEIQSAKAAQDAADPRPAGCCATSGAPSTRTSGNSSRKGQVVAKLTPSRPRFLILGGAPRRRARAEQAWPRPLGTTVGPARSPRSGAGRDVRPRPPGCTDSPAGQEYPQCARPRNTGDGQIQQHGLGVDAYRQPRRRSARVTLAAYQLMTPSSDETRPGPGDRGEGARAGPVAAAGRSSGRDPTEQPGAAADGACRSCHPTHPTHRTYQTRCHKRLKNRCRTTQPIPSSYPLSRSPTGISWAASGLGRWRQLTEVALRSSLH